MADERAAELDRFRRKTTTALMDDDKALSHAIDTISDIRRNVVAVLKERERSDHPLYGIYDRGETDAGAP